MEMDIGDNYNGLRAVNFHFGETIVMAPVKLFIS